MIKYVNGDLFTSDADVICHQVNCQGVMGSGVAKQVREKYPTVYQYYKALCDNDKKVMATHGLTKTTLLGRAQVVPKKDYFVDEYQDKQKIANLFAQEFYGYDGNCYTDYDALRRALAFINERFRGKSVAMPYLMGCHRGGGDWSVVTKIIEDTLTDCEVILYKYTE